MQMLDKQAARLTKVMTPDEVAQKHQTLGAAKYPWENWFDLRERFQRFLAARPELRAFTHDVGKPGHADRRLAAILNETKLRRVLATMLDENEFLSPYGIRSKG